MSNLFINSTNAPKKGTTSKSLDKKKAGPARAGLALKVQPPSDDEIDAHMRQKQAPKDYSYALMGAFSEGTYTEF
jgi:hypothetical protein